MEFGKNEYLASCASCHGVRGKGDGPVADWLSRPPADLTMLTENKKTCFRSRASTTSSMAEAESQCMREMPVWGEVYAGGVRSRAPRAMSEEKIDAMVRVRIFELIEYISTFQGK
jgi:mono/diheme cytochrome c family protein